MCLCYENAICWECKTKEEAKMTKKTDELKIGFFWEPKKKEIKEGMLVRFKSNVIKGKTFLGVIEKISNGFIGVHYSEASKHPIAISEERILDSWEIIIHEPKKLVPTKPYGQLVAYDFLESGELHWGVFSHMEGDKVWAWWFSHEPTFMDLDRIVAVEDIIIHEPKEQNLSAAQELSVQQESANFAHVAVQGIINAHAIKEMEDSHKSRLKQMGVTPKPIFTFDDFDLSVRRTWKKQDFKDAVSNAALGLTGEAGEVADLIKKAIYQGRGFQPSGCDLPDNGEIDPEDVKDELSDVLFYLSAMAQEFGFSLEDIAKHNREKLEKRFPKGFNPEASAQKVDKHGRKFPFKAKVVGDRDGNPTGMRHGLNYGRIVTVTGEIFGNCYKADGLTVFKDDLKEVTD